MKAVDLSGMIFGRLTVISLSPFRKHNRRWYECKCSCGSIKTIFSEALKAGRTHSCGCLQKEAVGSIGRTHGESKTAREYRIWVGMKNRCLNPDYDQYRRYGARGIKVSDSWLIYENFLADMGRVPSKLHSIDRVNVNGNYESGNCRWATPKEQSRNKRNTVWAELDGLKKPLIEWCEIHSVHIQTVRKRMKAKNITASQALGWYVSDGSIHL